MSNLIFPKLQGLTWDDKFTDEYFTLMQKAAAPGYETRVSLGPDPIIHFELIYNYLRQAAYQSAPIISPPGQVDEFAILRGFYRDRGGDFDSFLLYLPDVTTNSNDGTQTGQVLTSDANLVAPLIVTRGGVYNENIYEAFGVNGDPGSAPVVKLNGATLTTGYSFIGPGATVGTVTYPGLAIQFVSDPSGMTITCDFSWYYRVRFAQGTQEYDLFLAKLYSANKVELITTRTS